MPAPRQGRRPARRPARQQVPLAQRPGPPPEPPLAQRAEPQGPLVEQREVRARVQALAPVVERREEAVERREERVLAPVAARAPGPRLVAPAPVRAVAPVQVRAREVTLVVPVQAAAPLPGSAEALPWAV